MRFRTYPTVSNVALDHEQALDYFLSGGGNLTSSSASLSYMVRLAFTFIFYSRASNIFPFVHPAAR